MDQIREVGAFSRDQLFGCLDKKKTIRYVNYIVKIQTIFIYHFPEISFKGLQTAKESLVLPTVEGYSQINDRSWQHLEKGSVNESIPWQDLLSMIRKRYLVSCYLNVPVNREYVNI